MRIDTVKDFNKLVAEAKALCAANDISVKAKTLKPTLAETFGYRHETALFAALPVESALDASELAKRFAGLLEERVKPPLDSNAAEDLFRAPRKVHVVWRRRHDEKLPLYNRWIPQDEPHSAFITLDIRTGSVDTDCSGEFSGPIPWEAQEGRLVRRYSVPEGVKADKLEAVLSDAELLSLFNRVLAGSEVRKKGWDYVAELTGDAENAEYEIERWLASAIDLESDCGWQESVEEYLSGKSAEDVIGDTWDLVAVAEELLYSGRDTFKPLFYEEDREQIADILREVLEEQLRIDLDRPNLDALLEANAKKTPPVIFIETPHEGDERVWIADNVWDAVERISRELSRRDVDYADWTFAQIIDENGADLSSYKVYYSPAEVLKDVGEFDLSYPPRVIQELESQGLLKYSLVGSSGEPGASFQSGEDALSWAEEEGTDVFVWDDAGYGDDPEKFCVWINPNCMVQ